MSGLGTRWSETAEREGAGAAARNGQPRAADPERRALVAQEGAQSPRAAELAAATAAERDGAGAGEKQDAGALAEGAVARGLDVGDHAHPPREAAQPRRRRAPLRGRPHAPRGHHERAHLIGADPPRAQRATKARGQDADGYRAEFVKLAEAVRGIGLARRDGQH